MQLIARFYVFSILILVCVAAPLTEETLAKTGILPFEPEEVSTPGEIETSSLEDIVTLQEIRSTEPTSVALSQAPLPITSDTPQPSPTNLATEGDISIPDQRLGHFCSAHPLHIGL
ncbi:hypothetical protein K438DRAFT_364562 [Mycena galopus ATCC 62051]|nr:hypothetical protein K438DRAFT_364562 [Mycena galopus ATCC 62051]